MCVCVHGHVRINSGILGSCDSVHSGPGAEQARKSTQERQMVLLKEALFVVFGGFPHDIKIL